MNEIISDNETDNTGAKCFSTINTLLSTYKTDPFITGKILHYITEQLPKTLETMKKDHDTKVKEKYFWNKKKKNSFVSF